MNEPPPVVEQHAVHAAGYAGDDLQLVAHGAQPPAGRLGDAWFDLQFLPLSPDARRFDRLLQRHAEVDDVDDRLQHGGEDARATGRAERHERPAILQDDRRRHAAEHALAGRDGVGVAGVRVEQRHGVVEEQAGAGDSDLGAEQLVDGLRHGDHVAFVIGDGEMGGVARLAAERRRIAGTVRGWAAAVNVAAADAGVLLGREASDRHLHEGRIGHVLEAVGVGDLHHLGEQVDVRGAAEAQGGDVEPLEQVEHLHDVGAAAAGGGRRHDLVAAVGAAHRHAVLNLVLAQVLQRDEPAVGRHLFRNRRAEGTAVEHARSVRGDQLQARGQILHDDQVTR